MFNQYRFMIAFFVWDKMDETAQNRPAKTIAVSARDSSFWTFALLVNDTAIECQGSHPYDGTATIWSCTHEDFTKGLRHAHVVEQFSNQAVDDVLTEIRLRSGL